MNLFHKIAIFFLGLAAMTAQESILIKNGKILDGTGNSWFYSDVYISGGLIQSVSKNINLPADRVLDARGKIVSPGFIDVHGHIEGSIFSKATADNYIHDGVTTVVTGNCGNSSPDLNVFFRRLDSTGTSINVASLAGHNTIRSQVLRLENREPSPAEQIEMEKLVEEAMKAGAVGLSTGLIYIPGTFSRTEEIIGLARQSAKWGGLYASHIRDEGDSVIQAIDEAIRIGREAQLPVEISHFKITGRNNWGSSAKTLWQVEAARRSGVEVTIDQYPYTASSTNLHSRIPSWALAGGQDSLRARLGNPALKEKIISEMKSELEKNQYPNFSYAVVAYCIHDTSLHGMNIHQVNLKWGRPATIESEINTILDLALQGGAQMVYHQMGEEDVRNIMRSPYNMFGADAGVQVFGRGVPHPRAYGTNARVLAKYVREEKILSLEEAVRRMTSLPAQKFGFKNRGLLREGYQADIVIFDPELISDQATFEQPHAYSTGISAVIVNGRLTLDEKGHLGTRAGKVLKGPGAGKS